MKHINLYKNTEFSSENEMSEAFYNLTNYHWLTISSNDDFMNSNAHEAFYKTQIALLKSVIEIHQKEKNISTEEQALIDHHIDTNKIIGHLNRTVSYHDIYYMDENCDYYFVGDLHSDAFIIHHILKESQFFERILKNESFKIVFLGDYVDRGKHHLKTVESLMLLKYLYPEHIYLLMGNHDIGHIEGGEVTLYLRKVEEDLDYFYIYINELHQNHEHFTDELLDLYLNFMNHLNVTAFIMTEKNNLKAVHGGIPRPSEDDEFHYLTSFKQLTDDTTDHHEFRIRDCILWSDPSIQNNKPTMENKRFKFYENQLINYESKLGIDSIIRGHQAVEEGCLDLFDHRIYTIFSSGIIEENEKNINTDTAYDFVTPKILHYNHKNGLPMSIISLNK